MSTSVSIATLPASVLIASTPIAPILLSLQSTKVENWASLGATVAASLLVMWGRDKEWSLMKKTSNFVSSIFGGWAMPALILHQLPKSWLEHFPEQLPQAWAFTGLICGIVAAQFFSTLIWAVESTFRRVKPVVDKRLNIIGPDATPITDLGNPEQQAEVDERIRARQLKRHHKPD